MIEKDNDGHGTGEKIGWFNTAKTGEKQSGGYVMDDENNRDTFEDRSKDLRTQTDVDF